jgi:hypothetical protein
MGGRVAEKRDEVFVAQGLSLESAGWLTILSTSLLSVLGFMPMGARSR